MEPKKINGKALIGFLVLFSIVLSACVGNQMMVAPQDSISMVQGGPQAGSWESNDVLLNYEYVYQPGTLKLTFLSLFNNKRDRRNYVADVPFLHHPSVNCRYFIDRGRHRH